MKTHILKSNDKKSKYLSSICKVAAAVNAAQIQELQSNELWIEYWNLLKSLKSKIQHTKNTVDTFLSICNKMNEILTLKNEGKLITEDQSDFMINYVEDEFKEYFTTYLHLQTVNMQWKHFNKKVNEIMERARNRQKTNIEKEKKTLNKKQNYHNIGAVGGILAGITIFATGYGAPLSIGIGGATTVAYLYSRKKNSQAAIKLDEDWQHVHVSKSKQDNLNDNKEEFDDHECIEIIVESSQPSFKPLEPFFVNLKTKLQNKNDIYTVIFEPLQKDVVEIIDSAKALQNQCQDLIEQVASYQKSAR